MKMLIVNGSPRANGNTSELVKQFTMNIADGTDVEEVRIYGMDIKGCRNCGTCQKDDLKEHCTIEDDMSRLYQKFLASDIIVIGSPIYMWQFTPCTLVFLNRLHGLCSHSEEGSYNHMAGKKIALLVTLGDEEGVADYAVNGLRDMCEYFSMDYIGDMRIPFADKERISSGEYNAALREFAANILR